MKNKLSRLLRKRNKSGFTLVEVVISTALLGILIIGVLLFMTPVFGMLDSNEAAAKSDRAMSTMETYITKTLRRASYVKIFTNADDADITSVTGDIFIDTDYDKMVKFMQKPGNQDLYTLNCLSIRYEVDNNPRNNSQGSTAHKYMLYNETINTTHYTLDGTKSQLVFDESFYEDIYPEFAFSVLKVNFDASGNVIPDVLPPGGTPIPVSTTRTPGLEMEMSVYSDESMNHVYKVFGGKSYIECTNIKSPEANPDPNNGNKIYDIATLASGKDIYIFYITKNLKPTP